MSSEAAPNEAAPTSTAAEQVQSLRTGERTQQLRAARTSLHSKASAKTKAHKWTRFVHVYVSMISFLIVLFFAVTGFTLNHQDWSFGTKPTSQSINGKLPARAIVNGKVDWFVIGEYFRNDKHLKGTISNNTSDDRQGSLSFRDPGYQAEITFDVKRASYDLTVEQQGWVGVLNDLHKGRDANHSWKWLIDVSAGFLALISLTGLALQFFLRKRRRSALSVAVVGVVIVAIVAFLALN